MPNLTINGYAFDCTDDPRIVVGTPLTEGMVGSLAQTRRENLRNNFSSKVAAAIKELPEGGELSAEKLAELQSAFNDYAAKYEFGVRQSNGVARVVRDPVEREMVKIAREDLRTRIRAKYDRAPSKEEMDELLPLVLEKHGADLRKRAIRAIKEREAFANADLLEQAGV